MSFIIDYTNENSMGVMLNLSNNCDNNKLIQIGK